MSTPEVTVYSTTHCGYCERAKALLKARNVAYTEIRVDEDPAARQEMLARSQGQRTVPQIFIGHRYVGGFDALRALDQSGQLDTLLSSSS